MPTAPASDVALIARVREADAEARAAQVRVFLLAAEWADAHLDPDAPAPGGECLHGCRAADRHDVEVGDFGGGCAEGCVGDPDGFHDPFIPVVRWDAAAPFAAAIGRTSQAGSLMIRDALLARHRLPRVWRRVEAGEVEPHKARMLAQSVIGRPRDVSQHVDQQLAPVAHKIGRVALERAIDEAMLRLYPEQREADQLEALDRRFVTLHVDSINHVGIADMSVRGDWKDLHDFDRALSRSRSPSLRRTRRTASCPTPSTYAARVRSACWPTRRRPSRSCPVSTHRARPSGPSWSSPSPTATCPATPSPATRPPAAP
ncbi:hypothetical protein [Nocardioides sp. Soil805]|uniref:hypothetical protein n=1 Tax=Nocardioides sp. Soil805 TaxID=1736416 RepID=UPI0009E9AE95|nr:hypothetical protein [Nocardioides sp. Soil805]